MSSIKAHGNMFQPVADLLSWSDTVNPASSHPTPFNDWLDETEQIMDETLEQSEIGLDSNDKKSYDIAKEVGFSIFGSFIERARAAGWSSQSPEERRAHIEALLSLPQIPQRTPEWYLQGKRVLTASEFATLFKTPRAVSQLVLSKVAGGAPLLASPAPQTNRLACMTCEMGPFDWGIRFEPVVKQVLETRWGAKIVEAGRLVHPKDPLVAASPDGLILDAADPKRVGRLLEIKCPISREIGHGVPFEYWCQMQIQMEVTGIDECEYVEVKIDSAQKNSTEGSATPPDGHVWLFQDVAAPGCPMCYAYTEAEKERLEAAGQDLIEAIPWRLASLYNQVVVRDRAWYKGTASFREKFWADVEKARGGTFQAVAAKSKSAGAQQKHIIVHKEGVEVATGPACMILDD